MAELDCHEMRGLGKKEATTAALWQNPSAGSVEQWAARRKNTVKRRNRVLNLQPPEALCCCVDGFFSNYPVQPWVFFGKLFQ